MASQEEEEDIDERLAREEEAKAHKKLQDDIDRMVRHYKENRCEDSDTEDDEERPPKPYVDWVSFNLGVAIVIVLNAVCLGLEVDSGGDNIWVLLELLFSILFLIELFLRLYAHRWQYFTSPRSKTWNIIDMIIILVTSVDTLFTRGDIRFASTIRLVRVIRLARLIRLMKIFRELWLVANGLLQSVVTLFWIALMIFVFCYICAIFCTLVIGHNDEVYDKYFMTSGGWDHETYFSTVARSTFTLFQVLTQDGWNEDIVRHVVTEQPAMLVFFVFFLAVTTLGLLNIIVGVVVENTLATAEKDEAKLQKRNERDRQLVFSQLKEIFEDADSDNSGTLTLEEVEVAINKPEVYNKLKMIQFPVEDPRQIFYLLDFDECGELTIDEFITGCIRMNGSAKSKDLLVAQVALDTMKRHYDEFARELDAFNEKVDYLDWTARSLINHGEHVFLSRQERQQRLKKRGIDVNPSVSPRLTPAMLNDVPWENGKRPQENTQLALLGNEGNGKLQQAAIGDSPQRPAIRDQSHQSSIQDVRRNETVPAPPPSTLAIQDNAENGTGREIVLHGQNGQHPQGHLPGTIEEPGAMVPYRGGQRS